MSPRLPVRIINYRYLLSVSLVCCILGSGFVEVLARGEGWVWPCTNHARTSKEEVGRQEREGGVPRAALRTVGVHHSIINPPNAAPPAGDVIYHSLCYHIIDNTLHPNQFTIFRSRSPSFLPTAAHTRHPLSLKAPAQVGTV